MCQGSDGAQVYSIVGAAGVVGTAYVFMSYQGLLYITLQFQCAYAFSTEPSFAAKRVQVSVWNEDLTGQGAQISYQVRERHSNRVWVMGCFAGRGVEWKSGR